MIKYLLHHHLPSATNFQVEYFHYIVLGSKMKVMKAENWTSRDMRIYLITQVRCRGRFHMVPSTVGISFSQ